MRSCSSAAALPTSMRQPSQWEISLIHTQHLSVQTPEMQRPAFLTDFNNFSSSRPERFAWKVCSYFFLSADFSLQMPKREINCSNCVQSSQPKGFGQCLRFVSSSILSQFRHGFSPAMQMVSVKYWYSRGQKRTERDRKKAKGELSAAGFMDSSSPSARHWFGRCGKQK